jgi:hypothetical protein
MFDWRGTFAVLQDQVVLVSALNTCKLLLSEDTGKEYLTYRSGIFDI